MAAKKVCFVTGRVNSDFFVTGHIGMKFEQKRHSVYSNEPS